MRCQTRLRIWYYPSPIVLLKCMLVDCAFCMSVDRAAMARVRGRWCQLCVCKVTVLVDLTAGASCVHSRKFVPYITTTVQPLKPIFADHL